MLTFQGEIHVAGGKIRSLKPQFHQSIVRTEQQEYRFDNGWILPGLVDTHIHLVGLGESLTALVDLSACRSPEECVAVLQQQPAGRGEWLLGRGWDQQRWTSAQFPTAQLLDQAFPQQPVFLLRSDGHAAWVNTVALQKAGITVRSADPPGGKIFRDERGAPTGILLDEAMELVRRHIPPPTPEEIQRFIQVATQSLVQLGITEVHDMDVDPQWVPVFQQLAEEGKLPLRVQSYIQGQHDEWLNARLLPARGEFFQLTGIKLYADGALGSYGAALQQPSPADVPRFAELDVLPAVQPLHCLEDASMAMQRLGDRAQYAYPWRSLRNAGTVFGAGSDAPVRRWSRQTRGWE